MLVIAFLLITLIAMFGHSEDFLGTTLLSRPLVLGPLVGLVLGDPSQGIIIGATLELIFMGNIKVGAAIPPDVITGDGTVVSSVVFAGSEGVVLDMAVSASYDAQHPFLKPTDDVGGAKMHTAV